MLQELFTESFDRLEQTVSRLQDRYSGTGVVINNRSRIILHDEKYVYVFMKKHGEFYQCSFGEDMFTFLANPKSCRLTVDGEYQRKLRLELSKDDFSGRRLQPFASRFLYFYNICGLPVREFLTQFERIDRATKLRRVDIDHLNGDHKNNCYWNLAAMPEAENRWVKRDLSSRIKPPYFCFPFAMEDGSLDRKSVV